MLHFCTVHDKIYLYIYIPNAFYAKKRVFTYHFGEVCICCANQSFITPVFHMYPRCSQLFCLPKRVTNIITLSRLNRKHLYSTITFWKQNKMKSIEAERWRKKKSKLPYLVLPLCHLYNYNLSFYIYIYYIYILDCVYIYIKISLYAIASHSYTSSRSDYTQQGWK